MFSNQIQSQFGYEVVRFDDLLFVTWIEPRLVFYQHLSIACQKLYFSIASKNTFNNQLGEI